MCEPNIQKLRQEGIKVLYHFTDESNIESIRKNGLMSASNLKENSLAPVMNSNGLSRALDTSSNLQNYVRLSFCSVMSFSTLTGPSEVKLGKELKSKVSEIEIVNKEE